MDSGAKYGKLYNWYAINDSRGITPSGWHVPSDAEWATLTTYLGGVNEAGTKMKTTCEWLNGNTGSNTSGFAGLPSGYRYNDGTFYDTGFIAYWWSSSELTTSSAWYLLLGSDNDKVSSNIIFKGSGLSVRCLKD